MDARPTVKIRVKGEDSAHGAPFHHRDVDGAAGRKLSGALDYFGRSQGIALLDRENLVSDLQGQSQRRLDGLSPLDCGIAVKDLLQNLGIRDQTFPGCHQTLNQNLGLGFVRVGRSDQVHRKIGIDEGQPR